MFEKLTDERPLMRIAAFDHVRGLAAIFMIVPHVILIFGTDKALYSVLGRIMNDIIGTAPAAPVFMVLMGVFLAYPGEKPLPRMMSRGLRIYLLGTVLNIFRLVIPIFLAITLLPQLGRQIIDSLHLPMGQAFLEMAFMLDILQFAGIAFILISIMQRILRHSMFWILAGVIIVVAAPYLWGTGENWGFWYNLVQPLWGNRLSEAIPHDTAFPIFPWLVYPIAGVVIGRAMAAGRNEKWIFQRMLVAGLVLMLGGGAYLFFGSMEALGDYYRMYPSGTALVLGFSLVWSSFFMWLSKRGLFQNVLGRLVYWSKSLTLLYCVQWVLLGFSILFGFKRFDNPWVSAALTPIYVYLTYIVTQRLEKSDKFIHCFRWFLD